MLEPAERYTGYTAYDYLEPGKDYHDFALRQADRPGTRLRRAST